MNLVIKNLIRIKQTCFIFKTYILNIYTIDKNCFSLHINLSIFHLISKKRFHFMLDKLKWQSLAREYYLANALYIYPLLQIHNTDTTNYRCSKVNPPGLQNFAITYFYSIIIIFSEVIKSKIQNVRKSNEIYFSSFNFKFLVLKVL